MKILTWRHVASRNGIVREMIRLQQGSVLSPADGFFITLYDKINIMTPDRVIFLQKTYNDLFREQYPAFYNTVATFFGSEFNPHDFKKFERAAKCAFFFSKAYFLYHFRNELQGLHSYHQTFKQKYVDYVDSNIDSLLRKFMALAAKSGVSRNLYALHAFAYRLIKESLPKMHLPHGMDRLNHLLRESVNWGHARMFGKSLEDYFFKRFRQVASPNDIAFRIEQKVNAPGVLFLVDDEIMRYVSRWNNNIKVPDYQYITQRKVYPIDLKCNMEAAKKKQVSAHNLVKLLKAGERYFSVVFAGLEVHGVKFKNQYSFTSPYSHHTSCLTGGNAGVGSFKSAFPGRARTRT